MIASLRGTVLAVALDHAVIETGGVGLAVRATPSTLASLRRGETATLATTLVVREDSLTLFGFASDDAKQLFELVQSVSGVGPKIALALLAVLEPGELRRALSAGDTATLTRAPGIGKKGAERLVLELREKVTVSAPATALDPIAGTDLPTAAWRDQLVDALGGLGFPAKQATDAVDKVAAEVGDDEQALDLKSLLRRALNLLGRAR